MDILNNYIELKKRAKKMMLEGKLNEYLKLLTEVESMKLQLIKG